MLYQNAYDVLFPTIDFARIGERLRLLCGVSEGTLARWRRDPERMPAAARLLGELLTTGHLGALWPELHGWVIHEGKFCTWCGRIQATPSQVQAIEWYQAQMLKATAEAEHLARTPAIEALADLCAALGDLQAQAMAALPATRQAALAMR
ncbi:MAG TPA: hypothetical protein ENJ79_07865 [Gammaproteobacteria bacterium]|nr:hypothetical protein [Gammaproteobacteria bacterium]